MVFTCFARVMPLLFSFPNREHRCYWEAGGEHRTDRNYCFNVLLKAAKLNPSNAEVFDCCGLTSSETCRPGAILLKVCMFAGSFDVGSGREFDVLPWLSVTTFVKFGVSTGDPGSAFGFRFNIYIPTSRLSLSKRWSWLDCTCPWKWL